jgi:magnesium-protoporphyrin IX monomethyl ester (oxidative) cyclase
VNTDKRVVLQYEVKARMTTGEMKAMADANVILPQPGIESLSSKTLKLMRKGISGLENVLFLKNCAEYGLYPIWNFLYGLPNKEYDELSSDSLAESLSALTHLPPPASAIHIAFQRYTEYFNEAAKYGLQLRPLDRYFFFYPFEEKVVNDLAYTFKDPEYVKNFYAKNLQAVRALNMAIVSWMYRFRQGIPRLQFVGELDVFDSRTTDSRQFRITRREKELLVFLNEPQSEATIAKQFGWSASEVLEVLASLKNERLIFHDGGRYLNLVCNDCQLTEAEFQRFYVSFVTQASSGYA